MNVLDLFSGIGGFSLGLERAGMKTVAFCEIETFPRKVLEKHWPGVPIFEDVRKLHGSDIEEPVDLICGGYPCQPFSTAGKRGGQKDDRHLWPEYLRLIQEISPKWVVAENVAGHISMGFDDVFSDLEDEGYKVWPFIIPAVSLNAPHKRDRVWIIANANSTRSGGDEKHEICTGRNTTKSCFCSLADSEEERLQRERVSEESSGESSRELKARGSSGRSGQKDDVANSNEIRRRRTHQQPRIFQEKSKGGSDVTGAGWLNGRENTIGAAWEVEPGMGRVADGVPSRVDRIKALGNAVVPQIPEVIGRAIMQIESCQA